MLFINNLIHRIRYFFSAAYRTEWDAKPWLYKQSHLPMAFSAKAIGKDLDEDEKKFPITSFVWITVILCSAIALAVLFAGFKIQKMTYSIANNEAIIPIVFQSCLVFNGDALLCGKPYLVPKK